MKRIICNPLNLEYRYQFKKSPLNTGVYREAADPTMVLYKEKYLLFASMSGGFWYSDDLVDWNYKATPELPVYDYAPDVHVMGDKVVFCASNRDHKCGIYVSDDPLTKPFTQVSQPLKFWDPAIYQDDDGRVYLYWGCSTREPIWGIELDAKTFTPIGKKTAIIYEQENIHGWERVGENNNLESPKTFGDKLIRLALGTKPCIEGAFMTKHKGLYYMQYATPYTQHNVYSNGVYVGKSPLGPFSYQSHNPFSSKPGGFITAAGHGSTFRDREGKWWHTATMRISVNDDYERRIGLFPCDFDEDGILHCNQNFADYPMALDNRDENPQWMLLSYKAKVETSSAQKGYEGSNITDENIRTWWAAESGHQDEGLTMDLGKECAVHSIQINFADHKLIVPDLNKSEMVKENIGHRKIYLEKQKTSYVLEGSSDRQNWTVLRDNRLENTDYAHDFVVLPEVMKMRYLRLRNITVPMGGVIAVSGLRVFGPGDGTLPEQVKNVHICRQGKLNIWLSWDMAPGAIGYNVRYGIAPDKLYSSWQTFETTELDISMINAGQDYWFVVDSFNENGITSGEVIFVPGKEEST